MPRLWSALGQLPALAGVVDLEPVAAIVRLPSAGGLPLSSPDLGFSADLGEEAPQLAAWRLEMLPLDPVRAPELLLGLADEGLPVGLVPAEDLRYWILATQLALDLLSRQRFLPALQRQGQAYVARWQLLLDDEGDARQLRRLAEAMPPVGRALVWTADAPEPQPGQLLRAYLDAVVDALARAAVSSTLPAPKTRSRASPSPGEAWLAALRGDPVLQGEPAALAALYREYKPWAGAGRTAADTFRVCFRLDPPVPEAIEGVVVPRAGERDWTLRYLLQATDDPSLLVPAAEVWRQRGSTARFLDRKLDQPQERVLAGLGRASRLFPPVEASLRVARPEGCALTVAEAYDFVREKALLLRASGFGVLVPGLQAKLGIRVKLGDKTPPLAGRASFNWDNLVHYDWQVSLGDQTLTKEEFETLAKLKEPLVMVRGQWVELRPDQIQQALAFFERQATGGELPMAEALAMALAPDGEHGLPVTEVATEGWIAELIRQLGEGGRREVVTEPTGFVGQLREYQKVGVSWLTALRRFGLGACLADDMGLGKTVELTASLLHARAQGLASGPTLVICPTSVVGNWRRELARFAPGLRVLTHYGPNRTRDGFAEEAARQDVVVSTYALLPRDEEQLASVEWDAVVLDEAQNVKNPATKAAQTARGLRARWRAALTGTPIENRLSELWSIFQFLNPGYLGPAERFRRRFVLPIERAHDAHATSRLKALVAPFILRRVKTDRAIIADLPEKNEMKVFCTLTREQATLYQAILQDSLKQIEESEGMQRRGIILATLTKLKQVCDHPALFLHDASQLAGRSGKLARLVEMVEEVLAVRERALVFSQYAEMGKLLVEHLEATFGREVLFLHGGVPGAERDRMVARFQTQGRGPELFVLSLKAGGIGLNLTNANHVFHFDRWWNPAVENQATDRAFRIGQRRDVQVHKFICAGTFEEALDQLIESKLELSRSIVGTGEAWITEMSTAQLRELFALRSDAVGEE